MRFKTDWLPHLHQIRGREIEIVFGRCPEGLFGTGLELGAGDGYQSALLARYVKRLVATDYQPEILRAEPRDGISYEVCDAEEIGSRFAGRKFDLVFSSNLLEHLPDPRRVLKEIHGLLSEDGVTIHVMPGPFWKLCNLLLHFPNRMGIILERLVRPGGVTAAARKLRAPESVSGEVHHQRNNPKVGRAPRTFWSRLLVPEPHGAEPTHLREMMAFRRSRWRGEFEAAGFDLFAVHKGPVASGYGFGLDSARRLLETAGFASVFIYVAVRKGTTPRCLDCLPGPSARG